MKARRDGRAKAPGRERTKAGGLGGSAWNWPWAWVSLVLLLGGCASHRQVTVTVRDGASHEPLAGARVQVRPLHLFLPSYPNDMLTPSPHVSATAVTNASGAATLDAPARHPFELFVLIPAESPRGITIEDLRDSTAMWLALIPDAGQRTDDRALEVRVE